MIIDDDDPHVRTHVARMPRPGRVMRLNRRAAEPVGELLLRSVCHELRPPIATLSSLARAMEVQPSADRRAEMARLATEYAAHALSVIAEADAMVTGLSDLAGEAAPLAELLPSVAAAAPDGRLTTLATPAAARWPVHLQHTRQILINLVGNAVRHSPGLVRVGARQWAGRLRLTVADEGGPNPDLARALDRDTPPPGSNGLGLWVVRHLAAAHGGRIRARRARSGGLVMEVVLPRYRPVETTGRP
jgi:signal transduction histidine kinase